MELGFINVLGTLNVRLLHLLPPPRHLFPFLQIVGDVSRV